MKRWMFMFMVLAISSFAVVPGLVEAGNLDQTSVSKERKWRPSSCHLPVAPSTKVYDIVTYNVAVSMFNTYREEVSNYFVCASTEAEADYKVFREILTNSLDGLQGDVMVQFNTLKGDLELSRKAFE